jgi:hypothetical protein
MSARDTLEQLALANGISVRTATRYHAVGVNLADAHAVKAHKVNIRSRRGVSKFSRRTLAEPARPAAIGYEDVIEDLESRVCGIHSELEFFFKHHPELASELTDAFLYTSEVVERIGAQE